MSAEEKFFQSLAEVIEENVDTSRPALVYARSDKNHYTDQYALKILRELKYMLHSSDDFSNRTAPVDGVIRNHRILGTRVVEFDEFQHFTAQRKIAIEISKAYRPLAFHKRYMQHLEDSNIIAEANRTTLRWGFNRPVAGFRYEGGRMSQRAYFDTMKDYIHLSENAHGFKPTLRFSIPDFGVSTVSQFLRLDDHAIRDKIKIILDDLLD